MRKKNRYFRIVNVLIADSGGTKTAWCYIAENGERELFVTESYHPIHWSDAFFQRIADYWRDKPHMKTTKLVFFGAGCYHREKAEELERQFSRIGFDDVHVQSDLHAAGYACYGTDDGTVIIMGTGSVMFDWVDRSVQNVVGGKGHQEGDEGSGFYFGKLIMEAYRRKELTALQVELLDHSPFFDHLLSTSAEASKFAFAALSSKLSEHKAVFEKFHRLNIQQFIQHHITESTARTISIVGGYAAAHSTIFREEFAKKGIKIERIIASPIEHLVEQTRSFID